MSLSSGTMDLANCFRQGQHHGVRRLANCIITVSFLLVAENVIGASASRDEARVTRVIRDVKLLPSGAKAKSAALDDKVNAGTGVRTGDRSRSELTFVDLTIERLGANTLFSFNNAGRHVELESGSMLLRVPKDSGGAQMTTRAVTVGITGTTVILETANSGRNKLMVLEGGARISLIKYPRESVVVRGGQMEDVPPGATKLPPPVNIDLNDVMKNHPLITDFPALPSQNLIYATAGNPPVTGQPVAPGPGFIPPIFGNILGTGVGIGPGRSSGGSHGGRRPVKRGAKSPGSGETGTSSKGHGTQNVSAAGTPRGGTPKASPSPTPRRKSQKPN